MSFWEGLVLAFSILSFFLALYFLFKKSGDKKSNILFALLLFLFSYHIFFNVLFWSKLNFRLMTDLSLTGVIPLSLYGPFFYFYTRRLVAKKTFKSKDFLHLIPFLVVVLSRSRFYILPTQEKLKAISEGTLGEIVFFIPGFPVLLSVGAIIYGVFSYRLFVLNYKKENDLELQIWLKAICSTFILFSISCLIYFSLSQAGLSTQKNEQAVVLAMTLFILLTAYFSIAHQSVFNGTPVNKVVPFVKYKRTGLSKEFSAELRDKLLRIMETEKPYLNSGVRLDKVAQLLDISRHHASQIINEHFSLSFFDFINKYRIKEAERLLISKHELSITDIAYLSGFNNRVSFYNAFKKFEGITPTEFREQIHVTE